MNTTRLDSCKLFLKAARKVLKSYPKLDGDGLCYALEKVIKHERHMPYTIMRFLLTRHPRVFQRGISKNGVFSGHRLYFLLFITQLTPKELYDMITERGKDVLVGY